MALRNGLQKFWFQAVDKNGEPIIDNLEVSILTIDTETAATIYSDEASTSLTNPIIESVFDNSKDGIVQWFGAATLYDIEIVDHLGNHMKIHDFKGSDHRIVFDGQGTPNQLLHTMTAKSVALIDSAGAWVTYAGGSVTIPGAMLQTGDVLHIAVLIMIPDVNGTDALDTQVKILESDASTSETLMTTGDLTVTDDAGNDYIYLDGLFTIEDQAGDSSTMRGVYTKSYLLNATYTHVIVEKTTATVKLDGDIVISVQGDWAATHAENLSLLSEFIVELKRAGAKTVFGA